MKTFKLFDAVAKAARIRNRHLRHVFGQKRKPCGKIAMGKLPEAGNSGFVWMEMQRFRPAQDQVKHRAPTDEPTAEPPVR